MRFNNHILGRFAARLSLNEAGAAHWNKFQSSLIRLVSCGNTAAKTGLLAAALGFTAMPAWSQSDRPFADSKWSVMLFGGQMSNKAFGRTINPTYATDRLDIFFSGVSVNRLLYSNTYFNIELEGGVGYQFSNIPGNNSPQVWSSLYLRYKYFPWNRFVYTTVAINTGVNYSFKRTAYETAQDPANGTRKLLHYLAPEITFSHPRKRDWELVFRLHHRSGIYGVLGCESCGSNIVSVGLRKHF